ncbi:MAG: isoprenylcysteine carboxylmethyltransferase family protein [Bacteroidales bacterium]|nr:isoprenylcysteine carboxylmethyltransferase family protein [Bacteroidales bacterium]
MSTTQNLILFLILSIPVILISWRSLFSFRSHGFYRFFSWECILWLFSCNYRYWFADPFSFRQIIAWTLLIAAAYVVIAGFMKMTNAGKAQKSRDDKELYAFEKTTELIDTGIFKYIRHPLYASLLYLTWGIFFKNITLSNFVVSALSSGFLYFTALHDEKECMAYFGEMYREYMTRSKRFIPLLF